MPIPKKSAERPLIVTREKTLAKLARDATNASRQEATRSTDIADIFNAVHITSKEAFL
jgi:hypothetical protein